MKTRLSTGVLAILGAIAAPALAQDSQYWNIQYGPAGQLLGGQVVGSARDLSATYYNPGGLALAENPDFLMSVQAFKSETITLKPLSGERFLDKAASQVGTFPGFFGVALPKGWLGQDTRLAVSVLTRQEGNFRLDQRLAAEMPLGSGRYGLETLFDQKMDETWGGLTLSRRLSHRIGVGVTFYGVYRWQETRWEQSVQVSYPVRSGVTALVVNNFSYNHARALGKLGLAWDGDSVRLGVSVTTPSVGLFGSGNASGTRSATGVDLDGDGRPDELLINALDDSLDAKYKSSWAFAGGFAWRWRGLQLHASGEYFAPVDRFTILAGRSAIADGQPLVLVQQLRGVFNAGVGAEYWLGGVRGASGGTVLYGAFATDYTASRDIVSNEAASSNLDMYHISAGAAFNVKGNRFSLGIERAYGGRMRDFSFGGLPSSVPIIGGSQPVEVRYSRWVLALGYQFNRSN